jgi:transcription elongation factor Elf1
MTETPPNTCPWECPRCGKTALVNMDVLGVLGVVRCTCGTLSRPEAIERGSE